MRYSYYSTRIHGTLSVQGETAQHNLFIDWRHLFSDKMLYTAVSRARWLHQIILVVADESPEQPITIQGAVYKYYAPDLTTSKCTMGIVYQSRIEGQP